MKKVFLLAAAAMALAACNNADNDVDGPVAAQITATIGKSALTRASDAKWAKDDKIGITMGDRYTNMAYTTESGNGKFTGATMYFKNKTEPVTLTAYYPFTGTEGSAPSSMEASTTVDNQTPDKQPEFDFLYAKKENVTGSEPNVNLTFSHQMCKLTLTFKNGNTGTNVSKIVSYTLEGLVHDGTFNPVTGACAAKEGVDAVPVTMNPVSVENEKALPSLLLFPQTVNKLTLKIKDSEDQDYTCELKFADNRLVSGNNYLFTITVKKAGLAVNSSIADWKPQELGSDAVSDDSD